MNNFSETSPFGIYSPYGEFSIDRSTFTTNDDISYVLKDLGVMWVQELPPFLAVDVVPNDIHLYSRVGREAGMRPPLIRDQNAVWNYQTELTRTITKYANRYQYLEVDTEPDGLGGWKNDPEGYVQLLRISHQVIKEISPDCKIMFGGLSGGQEILDTQGIAFLEEAMKAGAAEYIDGIEFKRHHLCATSYAAIKKHLDTIGEILARYGLDIQNIPVFVETAMYEGDPRDPVSNFLVQRLPVQTEAEQAAGLVKMYIYAISLGISKIFWNLVYERSDYEPGHAAPFPQNPFNHYGLIHNPNNADGFSHKKLAYYTYKKMVEILEGSDWKKVRVIQESDNVCIYKFSRPGKTIHIAWWDYFNDPSYALGATKKVLLPDLKSPSAQIIEAIPDFHSGDLVSNYRTAFNGERLDIKDDTITLTLGQTPLYIET